MLGHQTILGAKKAFKAVSRLFKSETTIALEDLSKFDPSFVDKLFNAIDITMAENVLFNAGAPKRWHLKTDQKGAFGQIYWTAVEGQKYPLRDVNTIRNYTFTESLQKQVYDILERGVRFQNQDDIDVIVNRLDSATAYRNAVLKPT